MKGGRGFGKRYGNVNIFFCISINEIYAISVNEAYGKNGLETKSGGSLVFVETLG